MTVSELLRILSNIDEQHLNVFIATDEEGNSFLPVYEVTRESEDEDSFGFEDLGGGPALVIWP